MSVNTHFHLLSTIKEFPEELISDLNLVLRQNGGLIESHLIEKDIILVNFTSRYMESLFVTTNKEKTFFNIPFPDGSLYSGFKYQNCKCNELACIVALLLKYHLKENLIVNSDGLHYTIDSNWDYAVKYLKNTFDYNIEILPDGEYPKVFIESIEVNNIYDADHSIFNSMFKVIIEED